MWTLISSKKFNQTYSGPAELTEFEFSIPLPDQVNPSSLANNMIDSAKQEITEQGGKILEVHVWQDTSPTWETLYYVRLIAAPPAGVSSRIAWAPLVWGAIIAGIMILIGLGVIAYTVTKAGQVVEYVGDKAGGTGISLMLLGGVALGIVGMIMLARTAPYVASSVESVSGVAAKALGK